MAIAQSDPLTRESNRRESIAEDAYEKWHHWPVDWSAICVGTLAALAIVGLLGLIATAVSSQGFAPQHRVVDLKTVRIEAMAFGVCSAFFAFVVGGWVAARIAGILHSEPAMLHGAIVWLLATPALLLLVAVGAAGYSGTWYAGLAHTAWSMPPAALIDLSPFASATTGPRALPGESEFSADQRAFDRSNEELAKATRNAALFAVTALLLGLMGSVIGGWMASGEPMTLTYHRHRPGANVDMQRTRNPFIS